MSGRYETRRQIELYGMPRVVSPAVLAEVSDDSVRQADRLLAALGKLDTADLHLAVAYLLHGHESMAPEGMVNFLLTWKIFLQPEKTRE